MDRSTRRASSDDEFSDFVHAHWARLHRTAYLLLGDRALAEDLVQASLTRVYASWHRVRNPAAAFGYARTTMLNEAASWFRKRSWRAEHPTALLPEVGIEADPTHRPAVLDALRRLPLRQRAVVVLRYYDDLSVADTATALGISEGTVKSQTHEALSKLRVLLGDAVISKEAIHD